MLSQHILLGDIAFMGGVQGIEGLNRPLLIFKISTKFLFVHFAFRTLIYGGTNSHNINSETLVRNHPSGGEAAHPDSQTVVNIVISTEGILRLFTAIFLPDYWGHNPRTNLRIENKPPILQL